MNHYDFVTQGGPLKADHIVPIYSYILKQREIDPKYEISEEFSTVMIDDLMKGKSRSHFYDIIEGEEKIDDFIKFFGLLLSNYHGSSLISKITKISELVIRAGSQNALQFAKFLLKTLQESDAVHTGAYLKLLQFTDANYNIDQGEKIRKFEGMAAVDTYLNLKIFLDQNPTFIPSNTTLLYLYPSGAISWVDVEKLIDLFLLRGFKPTVNDLIRNLPPSIYLKLAQNLLTRNDPNITKYILREQRGIALFLDPMLNYEMNLVLLHNILEAGLKYGEQYLTTDVLVKLYRKMSEQPTETTLELLCYYPCAKLIVEICDNGIKANQQCLWNSCKRALHKENIEVLCNYKLFTDRQCFVNLIDRNEGCKIDGDIKFIADHGFRPDLVCVRYALRMKIIIGNLELYDLAYDDKLYKICFEVKSYPREYISKMTLGKDIVRFRSAFACYSEGFIRKFMEKNKGLVVDEYCFKNALDNTKYNLMKFIVEMGYNPNLRDIIDVSDEINRKTLFKLLFEKKI